MNVARVAAVEELQLKAKVEAVAGPGERALGRDDGLVKKQLVRAVSEEVTEILAVVRRLWVAGQARFDPAIEFKAGRSIDRVLRLKGRGAQPNE